MRAEDRISTEARTALKGKSFNDLPPGTTINTSRDSSFHPFFLDADFTLKISDEAGITLEGKLYRNRTSRAIYVNGATLSVSAVWYPTLF